MNKRPHFRKKPRPPFQCRVRYRKEGEGPEEERESSTQDIGLGGAFIVSDEDVELEEKLTLTLLPPDDWEPIVLWAVVRWKSDGQDDRPKGFGVKFEHMAADTLSMLNEFIAMLTA